jgi:hypothetical protein
MCEVVDFLSIYSNRPDLLTISNALANSSIWLYRTPEPNDSASVRTLAPANRQHYVAERLGEMVIRTIIEAVEAGNCPSLAGRSSRHQRADGGEAAEAASGEWSEQGMTT